MSADCSGRGAAPMPDRRRLRAVLSGFATGVTVVTVAGEHPHGMTANSFTSVSLDPPLVLVCVKHDARLHGALAAVDAFGVSVLSADQERIARYFSRADRPRGRAQFAAVDWSPGAETGVPLIGGARAWLECTPWHVYGGGDHSIFLGRLVSAAEGVGAEPLVFYGGQFRQLAPGGGS